MSTPNFKNVNASRIFSSEVEEEFEYDDLKMNIQSEFGAENEKNVHDGDRDYPGVILSNFDKEIGKWIIDIDIIIRSGYYSGVNLDWDLRILDTTKRTEYYYNELSEIKVPKLVKTYIDKKIKSIEKIFANYTTPLIKVATFSNGEAIYQRA